MARLKKFFIYFLMFVAFYLFVSLLTSVCMKENYKDINNYEINITSPKIDITESKATYGKGYIKGSITNDTGEHITEKYLQFNFYNENGTYLGTEAKEIKYFNVNEVIPFDINYKYQKVNKIEIGFTSEVKKPENKTFSMFNIGDEAIKIALTTGLILGLYVIIP